LVDQDIQKKNLFSARRADVLAAAYVAHPERFVRRPPQVPMLPR
jgi:hypothetical protein